MFLKILQMWQENTYVGVSHQKETPPQVFTCKIYEIFKNTYFEEHLRTTASEKANENQLKTVRFFLE